VGDGGTVKAEARERLQGLFPEPWGTKNYFFLGLTVAATTPHTGSPAHSATPLLSPQIFE